MSVTERLEDDLKTSLKAGEKDRVSVIRMVKAALKNREIEKGDALDNGEVDGVLMSLAKRAKDSMEQFSKGGRQELADKEKRELSIIQSYLPEQLSPDDIRGIIEDVISELGAAGPKDMGRVMKSVMSKVKGKADGRVVSELVKETLVS